MRTGEVALDQTQEGVTLVEITGEHDLSTSADLTSSLDRLIAAAQPIVVDLSAATFIDSSTLGAILDARRRALDAGVGFELAQHGGAQAVARVLEITGVRDELPVRSSRPEAIAAAVGAPEESRG